MQTKAELENWYLFKDPWEYQKNPFDFKRKEIILSLIKPCDIILDIGAGEGWITKDLPAETINAIEISDIAASRFPDNVIRVSEPIGRYDYVLACGIFYPQYDHETFYKWCIESGDKIIIAGIDSWLIPYDFGTLIMETKFKYREFNQVVRLYNNLK